MNKRDIFTSLIIIEIMLIFVLFLMKFYTQEWVVILGGFLVLVFLIVLFIRYIKLEEKKNDVGFWLIYINYFIVLIYLFVLLLSEFSGIKYTLLITILMCVSIVLYIITLFTFSRKKYFEKTILETYDVEPKIEVYKDDKESNVRETLQDMRTRFLKHELDKQFQEIKYQDKIISKELDEVRKELEKLKERGIEIVDKIQVQKKEDEFFIATEKGEKFHRMSCVHAKKIPSNKQMIFQELKEAFDAGYKPCEVCFPMPSEDKDKHLVSTEESDVFHRPDCIVAKKIPKKSRVHYSGENEALDSGKKPCSLCRPLAD